jgi:hypothetical protein
MARDVALELTVLYKSTGRNAVSFFFFRALSIPLSFSFPCHHLEELAGVHHRAINRDHLGGHGLAEEVRQVLVIIWQESRIKRRSILRVFGHSLSSNITIFLPILFNTNTIASSKHIITFRVIFCIGRLFVYILF